MRPLLSRLADRLWFDGNVLVIVRDGRTVRIPLGARTPDALDSAFVTIVPVLQALGESVTYDTQQRLLDVRTTRAGECGITAGPPFIPGAPSSLAARRLYTGTDCHPATDLGAGRRCRAERRCRNRRLNRPPSALPRPNRDRP